VARAERGGQPSGRPTQARTRLARAAVIDAARSLFIERGYAATTIEAISSHADVPQATVYRLFASKSGILKALLDMSIAGDDEPVSLPERSGVRAVFADPDPLRQVAGLVAIASEVNSRAAPMYSVLIGAASADADAAALLKNLNRQRREGQGQIARSLVQAGALRAGLREREAADMVYTLLSPEVYRLLVVDQGWSPKRYERWLTQTLVQCLLPPDPR
jgi:AcrR family transcriptional regulator